MTFLDNIFSKKKVSILKMMEQMTENTSPEKMSLYVSFRLNPKKVLI